MNILVGYTGFVGSNIYEKGTFDYVFNSKNIEEAYGLKPELLVYAGLRAEKYLANQSPDKDMELILQAEENIRKIAPKRLVLISTIDVIKNPMNVDESVEIDTENLQAYGYNRYQLELWARENYPDSLIIRLPALFGNHIKKNFIYDYIKRIPFMLKPEKLEELLLREPQIKDYYELQANGFYKCKQLTLNEEIILKKLIMKTGFSALNFTDSRSVYQFYPLKRLWNDIRIALENKIQLLHPATEPISAGELYQYLSGEQFINELDIIPASYNYKTIYDKKFGGERGYICNKNTILEEIKEFVKSYECSK